MKAFPKGAVSVKLSELPEYLPFLKGLHRSTLWDYATKGLIDNYRRGRRVIVVPIDEVRYLNYLGRIRNDKERVAA